MPPDSITARHTLPALDWVVLAVYALGMLAIGFYFSRRNKSSEDYHLGGRDMSPWAIGLSLFATLLSTISFLAVPSEMIHRGPMILFGMASYPLIVLIVGWVLIPRIMQFRVTTAYEILEVRLGLPARLLGSCIFIAMRLMWMAVIIYATSAKVLVPLAGLDDSYTPWVCAIMGLITLIYTSMGGLQAVVWTDCLQETILFIGAIACIVVVTMKLGGVGAWWPTTWAPHWQPFQFLPDGSPRISFLDMFLSALIWYVCTSGSDQMAVQRYLATRDAAAARWAYVINMGADVFVFIFCAAVGFALLAYYRAFPQDLNASTDLINKSDQLFPRFIVHALPTGVTGLVVAGLVATAMSSLSSGMSAVTSVVTVDFVDRFRTRKLTEAQHVSLAKVTSLVVGAITVLLSAAFVNKVHGQLLEVGYKVTNLFTVPLFLLFLMALFVPWATGPGAIIGTIAAIIAAALVAYWGELTGKPGLSFTWIMPVSLIFGVVAGCLASLLTRPRIDVAVPVGSSTTEEVSRT